MKKTVLLAMLLVGFSVSAQTQESRYLYNPKMDVSFLPVLGVSSFNLTHVSNSKPQAGLMAGVLMDIGAGTTVFQTGLSYLQTGSKVESYRGSRTLVSDVQLDYIVFHASLKKFFSSEQSGVYIKGGLLPMLNVKKKVSYDYSRTNWWGAVVNEERSSGELDASNFDAMAQVGLGFQAPAGRIQWGLELNFNQGLIKVTDVDDFAYTDSNTKTYNQGIMFSGFIAL